MARRRGFKHCSARIPREHVEAARAELAKHQSVEPGTVRYECEELRWSLDLFRIDDGAIDCVAGVITDAVKGARP